MKTISLFLLAAGAAFAADLPDLPDCAQPCLNAFTDGSTIAGCGRFDVVCICSNDDFIDGIACCLLEECDADGQTAAIEYAAYICGAQGVDMPTEIVCPTAASATTGASATSSETESATDAEETSAETADSSDASASSTDSDSAAAETNTSEGAGPTAVIGFGALAAGVLGAAVIL